MRRVLLLISVLAVAGCQSQKPAARHVESEEPFDSAQAAALVFDPSLANDTYLPDLSRDPRERSAFLGYEDLTTTFSCLRVEDRATTDHSDRYERTAITERTSLRTR